LKASPPTEEPERILLLRRDITFAFEDDESYSLLFGGLDGEQPTIKFEVDWDSRIVGWKSRGRNARPTDERRFTLYHENCQLFSFVFDLKELSSKTRSDIQWAQIISKNNKKKSSKEYHQQASLILVRDANNRWSCSFKTEVTFEAANEWSTRFLELSNNYGNLLARGLPVGQPDSSLWSVAPREFYLSVHIPEKTEQVPTCVQHKDLTCDLLPFQRRAVKWMLKREGVEFAPDASGGLVPVKDRLGPGVPPTFFEQQDKNGDTCYVSHVFGIASKKLEKLRELSNKDDINGGILAEEMGLGKTVELISLLCLHRREGVAGKTVHDSFADRDVKASPATLIITPPSILHQWQNEIAMHAPGLKGIFWYETSPMDGC
jgi:SNF2 family DNA or RNA helicase